MAELVEINWFRFSPETMQERVTDQTDTVEAYEMMIRMNEDEVEESNL